MSTADSVFLKLSGLMQWRQSGLVDSPEFKAAKRELLGMTESVHRLHVFPLYACETSCVTGEPSKEFKQQRLCRLCLI